MWWSGICPGRDGLAAMTTSLAAFRWNGALSGRTSGDHAAGQYLARVVAAYAEYCLHQGPTSRPGGKSISASTIPNERRSEMLRLRSLPFLTGWLLLTATTANAGQPGSRSDTATTYMREFAKCDPKIYIITSGPQA